MRYTVSILLIFTLWHSAAAQSTTAATTLDKLYDENPEFISAHTDKEFYVSGETLWYKLYLHNSAATVNDLSVIAYVELVDPNGTVIVRNKQRCVKGNSFGSIVLPGQLPGGSYMLKAYTLWMLNFGETLIYKKVIPVFSHDKLKMLVAIPDTTQTSGDAGLLEITQAEGKMRVRASQGAAGRLVAHVEGSVLINESIGAGEVMSFKAPATGVVQVALLNKDNQVICGRTVYLGAANKRYTLHIEPDKTIEARRKASFVISLRDGQGREASGSFSVSIRQADEFHLPAKRSFEESMPWEAVVGAASPLKYRKERFLYPREANSLPGMPMALTDVKEFPGVTDSVHASLSKATIDRYKLAATIERSYGTPAAPRVYHDLTLPADIIYKPADYADMPSVEEFLIEIVKEARVKRKGGGRVLYLWNTENKSNVYVYKDKPLLLVNGYVQESQEEVLAMDPSLIDEIAITWRNGTLSRTSIAQLADNGIVAIRLKDASKGLSGTHGIYEGFHRSYEFPAPQTGQSADGLPDFRDPIYWDPNVPVSGREKVSFTTGDELGEYVIDVVGMTADGTMLREQVKIQVRP